MPKKPFNYKKSVQALNMLANLEGGRINKMKALKLIWMADKFHLRRFGRPIVHDDYVAMKHGPVASSTKNILDSNAGYIDPSFIEYAKSYIAECDDDKMDYVSVSDVNAKVFSKTDVDAINEVYKWYGSLDKYDLRDFTHHFPEWKNPEEFGFKSLPMDYVDFFKNPNIETDLFSEDDELLSLSKEAFEY